MRILQFVNGITLGDRATITIACWTIVEPNLAVICACLTTIKPLVSRLFPRLLVGSNDRMTSSPDGTPNGPEEVGLETIGRRRLSRRKRWGSLDDSQLNITLPDKEGQGSSTVASSAVDDTDLHADHREGHNGRGL